LGFTDDTVIWFFQVIHNRPIFFDCYAASGQRLDVYIEALHAARELYSKLCPPDQPFEYGEYYLPHDARAHSLQTGRSTQELLLKADVRARIVPELSVQDGIQATRNLLSVCCIDETKCFVGVEALRQYQREWDEDKKAFRQKPRHDWTSHYADGFRMGAVGYREDYSPPTVFVPANPRRNSRI
jgi:phage terminase large subunit